MDSKIVQVALSGLENILRVGKQDAFQADGVNQFAVMVEEAYGKCGLRGLLDIIEILTLLGPACWVNLNTVLGIGYWVLGVGCWVLGVGCWVLGVGCCCMLLFQLCGYPFTLGIPMDIGRIFSDIY